MGATEDSSLLNWGIQEGSHTERSIFNFPQLCIEGVSEGQVVEARWCQQPHLLISELDFQADLEIGSLVSMDQVPVKNKRPWMLGKQILEVAREATD